MGLPDRVDYAIFSQEFRVLTREQRGSPEQITKAILEEIFGEEAKRAGEYAYGHTKIFMKTQIHSFLRSLVGLRWRIIALKVQRRWRIKMSTFKIRKITFAWQEFKEVEDDITS